MSEAFEDLCLDTQAAYARMDKKSLAVPDVDPETGLVRPLPMVRNENHRRMVNLLDSLLVVWYKYPQLRFGQFIYNVINTSKNPNPGLFDTSDEKMLELLKEFDQTLTEHKQISRCCK